MSREFLYRRLGFTVIAILALFAAAALPGAAQGRPELKRPEQSSPEKPPEPKKKPVKGPRAVGLLELNSNGKGTLIPIAILVDGKFHDASAYKADPVPMALESGTVYEIERAGDSQGLFTINAALHTKSASNPHPWVGSGSYLPNGAEAAKATRKAEDVPVGMDSSGGDAPPRLTRGNASKPAASPSPAAASSAPTSGAAPATGASEKPAASAPAASSQPATGSSGGGTSGHDAPKPAVPSASDKTGQAPPSPAAESQPSPEKTSAGQTSPDQTSTDRSGNYYRPTLRRGKPTQSAPEEDEPAAKAAKPQAPATANAAAAANVQAEPAQLVPAISDGGGPEPRNYTFFWKPGEEDERRQQMLALAGDEVRAYATALVKNRILAQPPATKAAPAAHKSPAKQAQPVFENIQFRAFDVWGNSQPVMILSAEAHIPPASAAASGAKVTTAAPETYSITLVARTDIYGNLRKVYSGVTDKFHLDVTPRLELIDAVDADGDGRGELLFHETTDAGSGYVIYRATADKLWKLFDSLGE